MVRSALDLLQPGPDDTVLDLFCGLGNFTLPLAQRAGRAVGVEADTALVGKAQANAGRNGVKNANFFAENLFEPAHFGAWAETPTIWCFSIRRGPGRLRSWNAWHSGARVESCIFPAIQGVWRAMRGSWCRPKGSA